MAIRDKTTTKQLIMREVLNYLTHNHLLYYKINLSLLQTFEKLCKEESSWYDRLSQLVFLKHLNKTHQGIMCETEIKIVYIKKHAYIDREVTTHVKIGE